MRLSFPLPSVPSVNSPILDWSCLFINAAAAASPKMALFATSFLFICFVYVSAVIKRRFSEIPAVSNPLTSASPYIKPEHPRLKSNAPAFVGNPNLSCKMQAVVGKK
jgi:hypothetical protein